jgi:hypothetical protein
MASRFGLPARPVDVPPGGSGSAADFLSFDPPPCVQLGRRDDLRRDVGGRGVAGTGGVLMGADHGAIDTDRPVRAFGYIGLSAQRVEDPSQGAVARPATMPVRDGLPASERGRHVPPRNATTGPPEHPVEDRAVIGPPPTATRDLVRQQRLQPGPFLVGQIMTMQHQKDLLHPALKIRGTRSSPLHRVHPYQ